MGFFGFIVDKLDDAVTDARVRHGAQREAARFARSVREGDVIYTTNIHHTVNGTMELAQAHRVGRGGRVGSESVAGMWLRNHSVSRTRPSGVMTLAEFREEQVAAPNPADAVDAPVSARR